MPSLLTAAEDAPPPLPASTAVSSPAFIRSVVVARGLAIFFMMYVHAWVGNAPDPDRAFTGPFATVVHFLVDVMGRSSVPLLTIISAYLIVTVSYSRKNWQEVVTDKFRTLLVPMWLWNGLFLLLIGAAMLVLNAPRPAYLEPGQIHNAIFALTENPVLLPLAFLRDMFVCALLSPLLIALMRRAPWPTLVLGCLFAIVNPDQPILLRPQLLLFYLVGLGFALHWKVPLTPRPWMAITGAIVLVASMLIGSQIAHPAFGSPDIWRECAGNLGRFGVALLFWTACLYIQRSPAYPAFARVETIIFIAFCSHFILFRAMGMVLNPETPLLPLIFLIQPVIAIAAAFALSWLLERVAPWLLILLNGGRIRKARG